MNGGKSALNAHQIAHPACGRAQTLRGGLYARHTSHPITRRPSPHSSTDSHPLPPLLSFYIGPPSTHPAYFFFLSLLPRRPLHTVGLALLPATVVHSCTPIHSPPPFCTRSRNLVRPPSHACTPINGGCTLSVFVTHLVQRAHPLPRRDWLTGPPFAVLQPSLPLAPENPFSSEQECIDHIGAHAHHSPFATGVSDQLGRDGHLGHSAAGIALGPVANTLRAHRPEAQ